jgi:DNA (cytosine-5)-methyltransferase 1
MGRATAHSSDAAEQQSLFEARGGLRKTSEHFSLERNQIRRTISLRTGGTTSSLVDVPEDACLSGNLSSDFDLFWLRTKQNPIADARNGVVAVADLFAGCGAMSAGVREACRALQLEMRSSLAIENDSEKLRVYGLNFPEAMALGEPIETLVDGNLGEMPTEKEKALIANIGGIDILIGGPPCQGHSDLNNFTRRSDPRNGLIIRFARSVELLRPKHLIIENVQGIRHDKGNVLQFVEAKLRSLGYKIDQALIECSSVGVPQRRRRFFLVGSLERQIDIAAIIAGQGGRPQNIQWACEDLLNVANVTTFESSAVHSPVNQERIQYLFDNKLFDLPDEVRPDCHRLKKHAYRAVYGRMRWDDPAPTITTGFGSTGQGRFVHPLKPRTLTPHEAARLQFIPDFFQFGAAGRTQLQKMIGNAVPPKISYLLALELLR